MPSQFHITPEAAPELPTLVELLRWRAAHQPDRLAYAFLEDGETETQRVTYGELDRQARAVAAWLEDVGAVGERALLLYPPGLDYIATFFGCLYAGVVAVPAYPPRLNRPVPRIQAIVADSGATVALTTTAILEDIERRFEQAPDLAALQWLNTETIPAGLEDHWQDPGVDADTLAFLQYTSGSTSAPKGVMLSHGNLMYNLAMIRHGFQIYYDGSGVFWLPSYHDMGLIGGILEPMYVNGPSILMPPTSFLQRPARWLEVISRYRGSITGAPNFAFQLCVDKITPEQRENLDLSCLRLAFCGAEPIRLETLEAFAEAFEPHGFRRTAFYPCYGLAESTLLVGGGQGSGEPVPCTVKRSALTRHEVILTSPDDEDAQTLTGCGGELLDEKIAIVDPDSQTRCAPNRVGEIWIAGQHVARGYWNRPEETAEVFGAYLSDTGEGPFLRTGDLGFMVDGELFVTGRLKDLIIIRGRNHYPQDIELTVSKCHPALQPDAGAAFTVTAENGEERLVIVQEVGRRHRHPDIEEVARAVRRAVAEEHGLQVYALVLIQHLKVPRTSSGKIQRHACRNMFLEGTLDVVAEWRAEVPDQTAGTAEAESPAAPAAIPVKAPAASAIEEWLAAQVAHRAGMSLSEIDVRRPFVDYGLDSVQAVSLTGELEVWLNRSLSPTLVWDYPNIEALAAYLAESLPVPQARMEGSARRGLENEPIAVIGLSCRFPGADSPEAFWQLLRDGVDAITEVPADRWDVDSYYHAGPITRGKMNTRWGGFLRDADRFDPQFFGISPREAARMDPQHRLFLEVAWEALERAGHASSQLAGSRTAVFAGISSTDYSWILLKDPDRIDAYTGTGNAHTIAANRISYLLDLRGPSMAVDTACSSSLVAIHLACQSLRNGESDVALAGGVNLLLSPELTITFSQARMMASDGRCKTFDARADGYVRGEGCGVVVLKRLSDALRDGDNVLAVVRGSAVNHDGRSNGLTAPNGPAQQAVIREALTDAGVTPDQISYVEAHGTGTPLGDPIEIQSLRAVLEEGRAPDQSYLVGSVKTNVGHLEAAAGIAGFIKIVLSLTHEAIPPHLHLQEVNPHISLDGAPLVFPTTLQPWPRGGTPRLAGVSSFGFGGTNAHVVLSEAPVIEGLPIPEDQLERPLHILSLSARSESALRNLARSYADHLADTPAALPDICFTANAGRSHFEHRLAVVAASTEHLREHLTAYANGEAAAGIALGEVRYNNRPRVAFLFTGQGAQYPGMGRLLYDTQPTFRAALDRCAEILRPILERPLLSVIYPERPDDPLLNETAYTQPALFSLEYALAELWRSWGIQPDAVMGHSVGEVVAACVAGVFNLEDGLTLIAERARLMQSLPHDGMMAAIFADEARVRAALEPYLDRVSIAALNSPTNTVISGQREAVQDILRALEAQGVDARPLAVSHAFHSPLMEPILEPFEQAAGRLSFQPPGIPLVSNLTGGALEPGFVPGADYWRQHVRSPVRFADGVAALSDHDIFLEIGPRPTLLAMARQCLPDSQAAWLPSLREGQDDWQVMLGALGDLYVRGMVIDWASFDAGYPRRRVMLPTYPFERDRYWFETAQDERRQPESDSRGSALGQVANDRLRSALADFEAKLAGLGDSPRLGAILEAAVEAFGAATAHDAAIPEAPDGHSQPRQEQSGIGELTREGLMALAAAERLAATESYLHQQAARVLRIEPGRLSIDQPLDTLGLDSLLAIELKNRVETGLGISVPVVTLLEGPTLRELAGRVLDQLAEPAAAQIVPIGPAPDTGGDYPLSYGQQALWFLHQLMPGELSFNVAGAVRVLGEVSPSALRQAFQQVVDRHPSLRTTFHVVDGQPVQRIHEHLEAPLQEIDAATWSEDRLHDYLTQEARRAFDLERGPAIRMILLRRAEQEHILLLAVDHIATDFWSMAVLADEMLTLYLSALSGVPASLPPLPIRPVDAVHWQMERLRGPEGESLSAYWLEQLAGELPLLDLPTDRPRPSIQTYQGDAERLILPPHLAEALKALARAHGTTLYAVLLAAFQVLLHRYSGQDDLLVGSVMAGRGHPDLEGLVGYFVNPVALRADLSGDPTFTALLEQVWQTVLGGIEHQDYPLALLAERLRLTRDLSRSPIFETMFILQKAQVLEEQGLSAFALGLPDARLVVGGLTLESMPLGGQPAQFDLTLMMAETGDSLAASLHYNTALFDPVTVRRMLSHFQTVLEGITAAPDQPVSAIPLLDPQERHQLLVEWNQTHRDYPSDRCIHHLFEAQVKRTPDAVAVACQGQVLTYRQLNRRANQVAHALQELGVGPDVLVGIYVERSVEMVVGLLGVLKAGGAYVPLDPAYPPERIAFMLEDSGASVLLTQKQLAPTLPLHAALVLYLDAEWDSLDGRGTHNPSSPVAPDHLAYVIYTSGSTGKPKGVQVLHRGVVNFLCSLRQEPGLTRQDVLLAVTTLSFDIAGLELYLPLVVGARVEIATREEASDAVLLMGRLAESGATVMQATPATWRMLIEAGWQGDPHLRILCGGEALPRELATQLLARCGGLWNMYGPTETTIWSTLHRVEVADGPIPIGRPIANTQVYLLDSRLEPVPIGVAGELYIGGDGVARGYLNRPELTAERFVPDPFSADPHARLYRTGDLARYRADGTIDFLGRADDQVKVRGFRIELGEIEAALSGHPAVQQSAVVVRQDGTGEKRLVAYLVPREDQPVPTPGDLRSFLRSTLPEYMIPALFVALDEMPLTANGKVNRRALPAPLDARPDLAATYVAPRTEMEAELAQMVADVLGLERVGVHDSFFDLGGNSLLATRLIFQVRERFQTPVLLRSLFEEPTVAGLAYAIEAGQQGGLFAAMTLADLSAEATLDPAITGEGLAYDPAVEPQYVLLTGATGFVGAFLLHDLLRQTRADVHCLVRASSAEEGQQRLRRNLEAYELWDESSASRIIAVPGDLDRPWLGLEPEVFEALARQMEAIYHNGAMVNFVYGYEAHKASNVLGTQEVLRLATTIRLKPVHFVSTLSVFHTGGHDNGTVFQENDDLEQIGVPFGGYAQSKWVAEKLVMAAAARGIPVAIYRPGLVSGASTTGAWNTDDMMSTLARACVAIGLAPDLDVMVDVVPVDYVSSAIVHLSRQPGTLGKVFHLSNPHPLPYHELIETARSLGLPVQTVAFDRWRDELIRRASVPSEDGWLPFLPLIEEVDESQVFMPPFDCRNTLDGLAGSTVTCPPVGAELLGTYLAYFNRIGFLNGSRRD